MTKEKTTTTAKKTVAKKMDFPNLSINLKIFRGRTLKRVSHKKNAGFKGKIVKI